MSLAPYDESAFFFLFAGAAPLGFFSANPSLSVPWALSPGPSRSRRGRT